MDTHRSEYKLWLDGRKNYVSSYSLFEKYGADGCRILLLENVDAKSRDELVAKESHYVRTLKCVNKNMPGRTGKEYYRDNIVKIKDYKVEYQKLYKKCDVCDCSVKRNNFSFHVKTTKHQNNLKLISDKPILTAMRAVNYVPNHENYE